MTITQLSQDYQIKIPLVVREALMLKPGDRLDIKVVNGTIVVELLPEPTLSYTSRLFGKHHQLWQGEDAVAYIRQQRESWRD